jgi:ABC-type cobalamin/Fe3+-siderophores transport system ATPase subunit
MPIIQLQQLSFAYTGNTPVLSEISFSIQKGDTWAIIGRNGTGKSTLLKCLCGLLEPKQSGVIVEGKPVTNYRTIELAKLIAYVPQAGGNRILPSILVWEFVMLGRFPFQGFFALPTKEDRKIVNEALRLTDTDPLAGRSMDTLSGGELQRVFLAAAVAQKTPLLLLDEPMSFLDPLHQELVLQSLKRIHDEFNTAIIAVTHEINMAINRFSHICALVNGKNYFSGTTQDFRTNSILHLKTIYSMHFNEIKNNDNSSYFIPSELAA